MFFTLRVPPLHVFDERLSPSILNRDPFGLEGRHTEERRFPQQTDERTL